MGTAPRDKQCGQPWGCPSSDRGARLAAAKKQAPAAAPAVPSGCPLRRGLRVRNGDSGASTRGSPFAGPVTKHPTRTGRSSQPQTAYLAVNPAPVPFRLASLAPPASGTTPPGGFCAAPPAAPFEWPVLEFSRTSFQSCQRWWHRPDLRAKGLPEAHGRGRQAAQRHPGRLSGPVDNRSLTRGAHRGSRFTRGARPGV